MAKYRIITSELHRFEYIIEANSEDDAMDIVFGDDPQPIASDIEDWQVDIIEELKDE